MGVGTPPDNLKDMENRVQRTVGGEAAEPAMDA